MARASPAARAVGERGSDAVPVNAEQRQTVAAAHGHVQVVPVRRERGMRRAHVAGDHRQSEPSCLRPARARPVVPVQQHVVRQLVHQGCERQAGMERQHARAGAGRHAHRLHRRRLERAGGLGPVERHGVGSQVYHGQQARAGHEARRVHVRRALPRVVRPASRMAYRRQAAAGVPVGVEQAQPHRAACVVRAVEAAPVGMHGGEACAGVGRRRARAPAAKRPVLRHVVGGQAAAVGELMGCVQGACRASAGLRLRAGLRACGRTGRLRAHEVRGVRRVRPRVHHMQTALVLVEREHVDALARGVLGIGPHEQTPLRPCSLHGPSPFLAAC